MCDVSVSIGPDILDAHSAHEHPFEPSIGRCHQRLLDQRNRRSNARSLLRRDRDLLPIGEPPVEALNDGMSVEADDFVEQLRAEPVHDAHDDDQSRDPKRHCHQADGRDEEDETFAFSREQVTASEHALGAVEDHPANLANADSTLSSCFSPVSRFLSSTVPAATPRGPTMICHGSPMRSMDASFAPPRSSRSS